MTEKKAQEIFGQYMQAELQGRNEEAARLEGELNGGGWYIVAGPEGTTIRKQGNTSIPDMGEYMYLQERNYQPYTEPDRKSYKTVWITVGVIVAILAIVDTAYYFIKKRKQHAAGV